MNETENTQAFNAQTTELGQNGNFEEVLQEKINLLQQCQRNKSLTTCSLCESLIGCKLRNEYVKAVYESMPKGQHGDFDFN